MSLTHIISGYGPTVCQIPSLSLRLVCNLFSWFINHHIYHIVLSGNFFYFFRQPSKKYIETFIIYEKIRRVSQLIWKVAGKNEHQLLLYKKYTKGRERGIGLQMTSTEHNVLNYWPCTYIWGWAYILLEEFWIKIP